MNPTVVAEQYVRKPLYVQALQVTEENFEQVARWCMGEIRNIDESPVAPGTTANPSKQYIHVRVHNPKNQRQTKAFLDDWLLYTERGYKVYTTKAFEANFDKVKKSEDEKKAFDDQDPGDLSETFLGNPLK